MDECPPAERLDELLDVLSDRRRRQLLYYLAAEERLDREALVSHLRDCEGARPGSDLDPDQSVSIELHHTHLPKLLDAGLIETDEDQEIRFRPPDYLDTLLPVVRRLDPGVECD